MIEKNMMAVMPKLEPNEVKILCSNEGYIRIHTSCVPRPEHFKVMTINELTLSTREKIIEKIMRNQWVFGIEGERIIKKIADTP